VTLSSPKLTKIVFSF